MIEFASHRKSNWKSEARGDVSKAGRTSERASSRTQTGAADLRRTDAEIAALLEEAGDGTEIEVKEFMWLLAREHSEMSLHDKFESEEGEIYDELLEKFRAVDRDRTGHLSEPDFRRALPDLAEEDLEVILGDHYRACVVAGVVDYEKFARLVARDFAETP